MESTSKTKSLLTFLARQNDYITAKEISQTMGVSEKTVYRLIKKTIELDESLINSQKGKGYRLNLENYNPETVESHKETDENTPKYRRNCIISELLLRSPKFIGINELYGKYYISDSVISVDEKMISKKLEKYHLEYQRENRKVRIVGKELDIRKAMSSLIDSFEMTDINEFGTNLQNYFDNYDVTFVIDQLKFIERKLNTEIPYPYNTNLFSHLYILIGRTRKSGNLLHLENVEITPNEKKTMEDNPVTHRIACQVGANIEQYLSSKLTEIEVFNLFLYLMASSIRVITTDHQPDLIVEELTEFYMEQMKEYLEINHGCDQLHYDLSQHIKPLVNRLKNSITVKNGLLTAIKEEYAPIFDKVAKVSALASEKFQLPAINDDEIGFIVLYFARAQEQNPAKVKTIIMCTTGVGTSELLKVKVAKKFSDIEIVAVASSRDIRQLLIDNPDVGLILTTVHIDIQDDVPIVLVSGMFTAVDAQRVRAKVEEIKNDCNYQHK